MIARWVRAALERSPDLGIGVGSDDVALLVPSTSFVDAEGRTVRLQTYGGAADALVEMYDDFAPQQRAQGTPPVGVESIGEWLETVLNELSVLAWYDGEVVGHVMFVPDGDGTHELAVFVHQRYQRAGIGTRLLRTGLGHGQREGVEKVWLSVEKRERGLHRLYRRVGFRVVDPTGSTYRMARRL